MKIIRSQDKTNPFYVLLMTMILIGFFIVPLTVRAQDPIATPIPEELQSPSQVNVQPIARDEEIETRLQDILSATGWFAEAQVRVQDGVVFLDGQAQTPEFKTWAGDLARNTQDVVAVVNQLEVIEPSLLDFQPLLTGLRDQFRTILRLLPLLGFSLIILFFTQFFARLIARISSNYLQTRQMSPLLQSVISRSIGILVFLVGLYLVFQIAGLTSIAFTILGGTGLLGLVLGIAFRDITENFLASIFLSIQQPFDTGDLVEIDDVLGFVQRMTTRATILMTLSGNHVQIPNATVYKTIIHNYTSSPNSRIDFSIGIGYEDSISLAQETVRGVLEEHPAILNEPEHLVLVESLGKATVNLRIYFWIDGTQYSWLKVQSSVIRLVKIAIQEAGISMPDEAREIVFPQGVPIETLNVDAVHHRPTQQQHPPESVSVSTNAEGGLRSEAEEIETQAQKSRTSQSGENLLKTETPEN